MRRIKAHYSRPPRQVHSHASVELRLAFPRLFEDYLSRFLTRSVTLLTTGHRVPKVERLLDAENLHSVWIQWQDDELAGTPPVLSFVPRPSCVNDTAAALNDLASDNGIWSQDIRDSLSAISDTARDLMDRLQTALRTITDQHGPEAARQLVEYFCEKLTAEREMLRTQHERFQRTEWTTARRVELRTAAERLRVIAATIPYWKHVLHWAAPQLIRSLLLSDIDRYRLKKAVDQANDAYRDRHLAMTYQVRLENIDQLLGKDDQSGQLPQMLHTIEKHIEVLQSFAGPLRQPSRPTTDPTTIELVENLDTVIDTKSGHTLGTLWDTRLELAGFSPEVFIQRVRATGLVVDGRRFLAEEWSQIAAEKRSSAMMGALRHDFGADNLDRPIRYDNPIVPIDHLAAVKLNDEALRPLINQCVPELKRRIAPFAPNRPIAEADPRQMVFLYCESEQRADLHEYLSTNMTLSIPEKDGSDPYKLRNPHVLVLVNITLGIPGGTLIGYQEWMVTGNRTRREHPEPPLFPRADFAETRLIDERDDSQRYGEQLFDAALKCGAIFVVNKSVPERFTLAIPKAEVAHHFTRQVVAPSWESAKHFQELIKDGSAFVMFVEQHFKLGGFRHIADRLKKECAAESVAQSLQQLNVIERNSTGQCRVLCAHAGPLDDLTAQLYEVTDTQLIGLERHAFLTALQDDNHLHNVLFWSVLDAFQLRKLAQPDVPEFVLHRAHAVR